MAFLIFQNFKIGLFLQELLSCLWGFLIWCWLIIHNNNNLLVRFLSQNLDFSKLDVPASSHKSIAFSIEGYFPRFALIIFTKAHWMVVCLSLITQFMFLFNYSVQRSDKHSYLCRLCHATFTLPYPIADFLFSYVFIISRFNTL